MLDSKIYSKSQKKEKNRSAAAALAGIARKNILDAETEELIRRLSLPRSKRYIELVTQYGLLSNALCELEAQLAALPQDAEPDRLKWDDTESAPEPDWLKQDHNSAKKDVHAQWTDREYHTDEAKYSAVREELRKKLEALKQELEEIEKEVQKELPEASKQLGIIYDMDNEGKLTQMGVINRPGTPIPTIAALDASTDYADEQEKRQWHKAYGVAEAADRDFLTIEVYRTIVCKVMDDGRVTCYRE